MFLPLGLFAVAAVGGVIMAVRIFAGGTPPWVLSLLHATFGAAGIVTLAFAISEDASQILWIAVIIFVVAALGGFALASFHLRGKPHWKPLIGIHALAALSAFGIVAASAFGLL